MMMPLKVLAKVVLPLLFVAAVGFCYGFAETLGDALLKSGVKKLDQALPDEGREITSHSSFSDDQILVIAYYHMDPIEPRSLPEDLNVLLVDKATGRWEKRVLGHGDLPGFPRVGIGSISSVTASPNYYFVTGHTSPSCAPTLTLSRRVEPMRVLPGWLVTQFEDETLVFQNCQPHGSPYWEISFHDPATGSTRRIYPPEPASTSREEYLKRIDDVFRTAEASGRLSEFILQYRSRESGEVLAIDRQSRSLAVLVSFDETIGWERKLSDRFSAFSLLRRFLNSEKISEIYRDKFDVLVSDMKRNHLIEEAVSGIEDEELRGLLVKLRARLADVKYGAPEELQSVDRAWLADRTWEKLKNALIFPPASTKVVYIYPELNTRLPLEWYEVTPAELEDRFQISDLKNVLDPVVLRRVRSDRERSPANPAK